MDAGNKLKHIYLFNANVCYVSILKTFDMGLPTTSKCKITTSVAGNFLSCIGQSIDQYINFNTYLERNPCKFGLCILAKLLKIQISMLL